MDNFKIISDSNNDQSANLISGKSDHKVELSSLELVGNLPYKNASANMLTEVADHFKTTFSNVAKGEASASEYLEVGAIALGIASVGFAAGRMMQRSVPLVVGRSESATSTLAPNAPNATAFTEQTNALASNVIKFERKSAGAVDSVVNTRASVTDGFATVADAINAKRNYSVMDAFAATARKHSSGVQSELATVEKGSVSVPKNLAEPGSTIRWNPAEGGRNATYAFQSVYSSNKELASLIPEIAASGDDLYINLKGSISVTDEGLRHFIKAKDMLKKLDLSGTSVTEHGATRLKMALPNTEILFDKSQALTPLGRAIAKASLQPRIRPWDRASYQWVPPREIAEVVFRQPH